MREFPLDLKRHSPVKPVTPTSRAPAAPPVSQPAAPVQLRVGLIAWLAGHSFKLVYRVVTATLVHDRPSSVLSKDPNEHATLRRISAVFWSIIIPLFTLIVAGPIPAAALTVFGLFLLVRHRAARESIAVTPTSLVADARILAKSSTPWRTIAIMAAVLTLAGGVTAFLMLSLGQILLSGAWLLSLPYLHAAAVRGVEELEGISLSTPLERTILALSVATNRGVAALVTRKAGTDVAAR